ncbi:MAG: hypothetical protein KGL12_11455 [Rhodospirillales bacterium]|nr:hypothetical protein [Rhodospirillales bacterium]
MKLSLLAASAMLTGLILTGTAYATPRSAGDAYTSALNTLYAQGWHDVSQMHMKNGMVSATATSPHGHARTVQVNTVTGMISQG